MQIHVLYAFQLKTLHRTISYKAVLGTYNMPSLTTHLYVFDLSFLKITLEILFTGFYTAKDTCYFLWF